MFLSLIYKCTMLTYRSTFHNADLQACTSKRNFMKNTLVLTFFLMTADLWMIFGSEE